MNDSTLIETSTLPELADWEALLGRNPLLLLVNYTIEDNLISPGILYTIFESLGRRSPDCFKGDSSLAIEKWLRQIYQTLNQDPDAEDDESGRGNSPKLNFEEFQQECMQRLKNFLIEYDEFSNHEHSSTIVRFLLNQGTVFDPLEDFPLHVLDSMTIESVLLPKLKASARNRFHYWVFHPDARREGISTEEIAFLLYHSPVDWLTEVGPKELRTVARQVKSFVPDWAGCSFYKPLVTLLERKSALEIEEDDAKQESRVELAGFLPLVSYPESRPAVLDIPDHRGATHIRDLQILKTAHLQLELSLFKSRDGRTLLRIELYSDKEHFELKKFKPLQPSIRFLTPFDVPTAWVEIEDKQPVYIDIRYKLGIYDNAQILMISLEE